MILKLRIKALYLNEETANKNISKYFKYFLNEIYIL